MERAGHSVLSAPAAEGARIRLEGQLEVIEEASVRYGRLEGALRSVRWRRSTARLLPVLDEIVAKEQAVDAALLAAARLAGVPPEAKGCLDQRARLAQLISRRLPGLEKGVAPLNPLERLKAFMRDPQPYDAAWKSYRLRLFFGWLSFLGLPALLVVTNTVWLAEFQTPLPESYVTWCFAPLWFVSSIACSFRLLMWSCPRCGQWFFFEAGVRNPLASRCLHCGLPKWTRGP